MYIQKEYSQFLSTRQVKRSIYVFTLCLLILQNIFAMENNGRGTKAIGMCNAFVAVADNTWAIDYNPAGLSQVKNAECSVFVIPGQFGLPELRTIAVSMATPVAFTTIGIKLEKFGFDLYKETELGIGISAFTKKNISIGLSVNIDRYDIERYGTTQKLIFDLGTLIQAVDNIKIGFNFSNVIRTTIGRNNEKIPQVFTLGLCWLPVDDFHFSVEAEKDIKYPVSIKVGVEKVFLNTVSLRAGISNNPDKYSAGIGIRYSAFEFGYAGYSHYDLGWTNQIDLSFNLDS